MCSFLIKSRYRWPPTCVMTFDEKSKRTRKVFFREALRDALRGWGRDGNWPESLIIRSTAVRLRAMRGAIRVLLAEE